MQNTTVLYTILLVATSFLVGGCRKTKHNSIENIEYRNTLVYYNNGEYIDYGNIDGGPYYCDQSFECPLVLDGQSYPNLCKVSYTFLYNDAFAGYDILFQYTSFDTSSNISIDSVPFLRFSHNNIVQLEPLFKPQSVKFATHPDSLGCYISFTDRDNGKQYTSIPPSGLLINVNTDSRFYFQFIDSTRIAEYGPRDTHTYWYKAKYSISARGQFAVVLYSTTGDSLMITGGEFRLPFCE